MPVSSAGLHPVAAGHAKRADLAVLKRLVRQALKELGVLGIGKRIAALDKVEAQLVQPPRNQQLVLERKVHAFALGAVPESGVVGLDVHGGGFRVLVQCSVLRALLCREG